MALDTTKPATLTADEISTHEANSTNRSKVQKVRFKSEVTAEPACFLIVKPGRMMIEAVAETSEKKGLMAGNDLLINSCVLAGPVAELESDDDMYFGLAKAITELMNAKKKI